MFLFRPAPSAPDHAFDIDPGLLARLSWDQLEALMQIPDPEPRVIRAYCEKALSQTALGEQVCLWSWRRYSQVLLDGPDPKGLADILLRLPFSIARTLPSWFFLRLGARLERIAAYEPAVRVYYLLGQINPYSFDFEAALLRLASIAERPYADNRQALAFYNDLLRLFPEGAMALLAEESVEKLKFRLRYAQPARDCLDK